MSQKIKIAIDVSPTLDGNSTRGVGYYTQNLIDALQKEIKINPDYKNWSIDLIKNIYDLQAKSYNLIHYPYFDPFKLTLPQTKNIPTVVTVHDLIPRQFKSHFPVGIKGELKWFLQKHRLKKTSHIITVSQYSKTIIQKIIKLPGEKITPIYEAAGPNFKLIKDTQKIKEIKNKYSLPEKFVLFIGDINWNKNIPNLVKVCLKNKYPLVIVGSAATKKDVPDHPWTKDLLWLQSKTRKLQNSKSLILTGFVPDEDLPVIYNLATIYCQPSYAEGFGLPLVEAMQSGCPVAFSRDTCLPEIMDNCGVSFNPRSVSDISTALKKLWLNTNLRQKYQKCGLQRSKKFKWEETAKQTLLVYQSLFGYEK
ncbi:MAG: glycosyltransferase family 4 protein [Candidatus Shapirobacteria bacterium]|nr:glycosyltransferase family 4 protein [Candidatus Shapirobacteria bacterium]